MAKVNAASSLLGGMLEDGYIYQAKFYREIARRFVKLPDKDSKRFREESMLEGVPEELFKMFERWEIVPERTIGNGNKTLEMAQVDRLMAVRPLLDPPAQRELLNKYVMANTDDPQLADHLVPLEDQAPSPAVEKATLAWGTLIDGKPVIIASGINPIEYIETLLKLLDQDLQRIEQEGGNPDGHRIQGLANVIQHIQTSLQWLAQDPQQKERVKQYQDALSQAANYVKAYAQRWEEQQQQQGGEVDPKVKAEIEKQILLAQTKAKIAEENAQLKQQQKVQEFQLDQQLKAAETEAEIAREDKKTAAEMALDAQKRKAEQATK
jgi:hypothetical protein